MKLDDIRRLSQKLGNIGEPRDVQKLQELLREMGIDPGSFYQELEMSSRYVDTHRDVSWSNASVSLHSHSFYEILYCRNTCGAEYLAQHSKEFSADPQHISSVRLRHMLRQQGTVADAGRD